MSKVVFTAFIAMAVIAHAETGPPPTSAGGEPALSPSPGSLDALYPPAADRPVYLIKMIDLETRFSGIVVDLMEEDLDGARGSFDDFRRQYRELAGLVPEWKGGFPEEKVGELGAALDAGDRGAAMKAFTAVGGICHRCHVVAMVPVQQRYRWGDIGASTIQDPVIGAAAAFPEFKRRMSANLAGITNDLRQGQTGNARKQYEEFRARFDALSVSCRGCHEKERRYFVDSEMRATVEKLGKALQGRTVEAESASALVQEIGRESCSKCHLVHLPAAMRGVPRADTFRPKEGGP